MLSPASVVEQELPNHQAETSAAVLVDEEPWSPNCQLLESVLQAVEEEELERPSHREEKLAAAAVEQEWLIPNYSLEQSALKAVGLE